MTFAQTLKRARARLGISQAGLAARLGVPLRTLQNYEIGHRAPDPFKRAAILDLLAGSPKPKPRKS